MTKHRLKDVLNYLEFSCYDEWPIEMQVQSKELKETIEEFRNFIESYHDAIEISTNQTVENTIKT